MKKGKAERPGFEIALQGFTGLRNRSKNLRVGISGVCKTSTFKFEGLLGAPCVRVDNARDS
jgi:hypothetical protein